MNMGVEKGAALITGASAGLGLEYARICAADGHPLILVARRKERLEEICLEIRKTYGVDAHAIAVDLMDQEAVTALCAEVAELSLFVELLINNAGFGTAGPFSESALDGQVGQIKLNVIAPSMLTHHFLPFMLERRRGHILNIGSTAGFQPGPYMATYYASKACLNSFSEALAYELKGTGVTVTVHCPGPTQTEFAAVSGISKSNLFKRGGIATAENCAKHGYRAMRAGKSISVHGLKNKIMAMSVRFTPRFVVRALTAFMNS